MTFNSSFKISSMGNRAGHHLYMGVKFKLNRPSLLAATYTEYDEINLAMFDSPAIN